VRVPWWGLASSVLAPVLLIGGWTVAAGLQPAPFDAVQRSISTLAEVGMPYRWLMTLCLLGVGLCDVLTGLALQQAADRGRLLLIAGGVCGMLIAANPQIPAGGSPPHEVFSFIGVIVVTIWPVAALRREPDAPLALRPRAAWTASLINLAVLLWFTVELFNGPLLGLAERAVTADQAIWPLIVVLSVLASRPYPLSPAGLETADARSQ
jgi:hypothetical membrane protein